MIAVRGVSVRAGRATLLEDVTVEIADGERVAIVGPNGAGKSTLLGAVAGDLRLARGTVLLAGAEARALAPAELARRRAVLLQRSELALAFTALEVVQLAGTSIDRALAGDCLARVGLADLAPRSYPTLSGGEQQRVQFARVLAQLARAPRAALLLDEPTAALDPREGLRVLACAREAAARGHATVAVLHDLTLAARWADRIVLLANGRVVDQGLPDHVLAPRTLESAYGTPFERLQGAAGVALVAR